MRFIFFTKTNWVEPARLRHQLARLLVDAGHEVVFFQKPLYPWQHSGDVHSGNGRISLYRHKQLVHHKLRLSPFVHWLNAYYEKNQIMDIFRDLNIGSDDLIVNFNYEYYFLRAILPSNKIITIINDDFWTRAFIGWAAPLKWALRRTIQTSDRVLTVSKPLRNYLSNIAPVDLFYPWSDATYTLPQFSNDKKILLFWGYINNKLDFYFISRLAQAIRATGHDWRLVFVGPVEVSIASLVQHENITFMPPSDLDLIDISSVFVGIIPYKRSIESINVITFPNKLLRLLSKGIPIAITGMPEFIDESFVFRLDNDPNVAIETLDKIRLNFEGLQPAIKDFVASNSSESRLQQFIGFL